MDERGAVLLARRPAHAHQGGLWEFPGGKLQAGEAPRAGLGRELAEELGIEVTGARPLIRVRHDYGDRAVILDVWRVEGFRGTPRGLEGQPLAWVEPERLAEYPMPAADGPIVSALRLPCTYLITGEPEHGTEAFLRRLDGALARGVRMVQVRAHSIDPRRYRELAREAIALCRSHGARVLLNAEPRLAAALGADGVHLTSARLLATTRRPLSRDHWLGASCHTRAELDHAQSLGMDFAVLSPVRVTASHPEHPPLGWRGLAALIEEVSLPVYALGGVGPEDLETAFASGAQGIAAIGALWAPQAEGLAGGVGRRHP